MTGATATAGWSGPTKTSFRSGAIGLLLLVVAVLSSIASILLLQSWVEDWFGSVAISGTLAVTAISIVHPRGR